VLNSSSSSPHLLPINGLCSQVVSATPPSIAIEALVLGGPESVRVVCFTAAAAQFSSVQFAYMCLLALCAARGTGRVLVCAPSNRGVQEVCERFLGAQQTVAAEDEAILIGDADKVPQDAGEGSSRRRRLPCPSGS
jgi:hypothetical protein